MYTPILNRLLTAFLMASPALSAITMSAFSDNNCGASGGNVVEFVIADQPGQSSQCANTSPFSSVSAASITDGFTCTVYADSACTQQVQTIGVEICQPVVGQAIICSGPAASPQQPASPAQPVAPGGSLSAAVNVGTKKTDIIGEIHNSINKAKNAACNDIGCDQNNEVFTNSFENFGGECRQSMKMEGNYDSPEQRDFMANALGTALAPMVSGERKVGGPNGGGILKSIPNFAQVVVNDPQGNNRAEMRVAISTLCNERDGADGGAACDSKLAGVAEGALGAIPVVGGFAVLAFKVVCAAS